MPVRSFEASPPLLVVMGVSGSGKSTVGAELAARLRLPFADADDFHPAANIAKMSAGVPLADADRRPWLRLLGDWLAGRAVTGAVLSCSALKRRYRDRLRAAAPSVTFLHLAGPPEVIARRVAGRLDHFMPSSLVRSQYAALEPLRADEAGVTLDLGLPVEELVGQCLAALDGHPVRMGA
ncbi:gluconokinase [Pseudonocardia eucalypti]|uniref:Gluconokinase n=1 Tax=Pseudonocardia eucalypti TaxID=648755 RepID=A0ABP9QGC2_9PSEU|nr:gluconokinase [Pseudonocardia eucalypti]